MAGVVNTTMREIEFEVLRDGGTGLVARNLDRRLQISAPSLEELHHKARDVLIRQLGSAHGTYRVKWRRIWPNQSPGRS